MTITNHSCIVAEADGLITEVDYVLFTGLEASDIICKTISLASICLVLFLLHSAFASANKNDITLMPGFNYTIF